MNDQKLENLLNLALDATSEELERSERLSEGYDRADNTWDLIIKYNGDLTELEREGAVFTPLVNEYAIVTIRQELILWLAAQVQVEYIEKPKRLFFQVANGKRVSCIDEVQKTPFCIGDEPKSGLARDLGDCLQSRNVPFGTSGDS